MQCHKRRGLQQIPVENAQNPHIITRPSGGSNDTVVLVDHLHEIADDEGNGLAALHLFLCVEELALEILLIVLDLLLLDFNELELALQRLERPQGSPSSSAVRKDGKRSAVRLGGGSERKGLGSRTIIAEVDMRERERFLGGK